MKGVLCFNGPVTKVAAGKYYSNMLNSTFLEKYFNVVDELVIATRVKEVNDDFQGNGLNCVEDKRISFVDCPDFTTPKQVIRNKKKLLSVLESTISSANIVFVRVSGSIAIQAAKVAYKNSIPCLVEVVTCAKDVYWNHSLKGKISMPFMYHQMKDVVYNADYVQYITEQFMQLRYPTKGKSYVCSNALIECMSEEKLCNRKNKYTFSLYERTIHIATVGTLTVRYKGQEDVIKALSYLRKRGYTVMYHMIGSGDTDRLKKLALEYDMLDSINFVGNLLHEDVLNYLDNMDIYIQPSWAEAQGRSLIEALSRGLPCVCTNVGGMPELVQKEYICKKKNSRDLARVILRLLESDLKHISELNYKKSLEFEKEKLIQKRQEIFKDVANSGVRHE